MEDTMTKDLVHTALLTLAVCLGMVACSGILVTQARSEGLETAIAACKDNPKCTYGALDSDGGLLFKLETDGGAQAQPILVVIDNMQPVVCYRRLAKRLRAALA
jgi:hypothetical protein